jgi:hypothetical protein
MPFRNRNRRSNLANQLKLWGIYIGLSLAISFLVPFPSSLLMLFLAILGIDYFRTRQVMKKMGISAIREMFRSFSNPQAGYSPLKYFCMNCGNEHREISCPKCGSKMKRVG